MKPEDLNVRGQESIQVTDSPPHVEIWTAASFAQDWFTDAVREAKVKLGDIGARRREILFSVAFAESYIMEWVRDKVLKEDFKRLREYFPPGKNKGAKEKWEEVPKKLYNDKLIPGCPDLSKPYWTEWTHLVKYRNGLVHAAASRPESAGVPAKEKPLPAVSFLKQLQPGWAIKTVVNMITELHGAVGTPLPGWITLP